MTCPVEEDQSTAKETITANTEYIPMKHKTENISPLKKNKRPHWHKRSPIQDIFFRYGEYFS